jgi:phosphate transport system substrate-binding protein
LRAFVVSIAGAACLVSGPAAAADQLRIAGTGNALGTMHQLGDAFMRQNPAIKVIVLPSVGTSGAIKGVAGGAFDIGLSSRVLTRDESNAGSIAVEYARTPLVFAVSTGTDATAVTLAQVADIYSGKMTKWADGRPIRPLLRQPGDTGTAQLKAAYEALGRAFVAAEQRPGAAFATTDQEAADKLESIPGAIGTSTLSLIVAEKRALRALTLDGVEPTVANAAAGRYRDVTQFYLVTTRTQSPVVQQFIAYVRSAEGRAVLAATGNWVP